MAIPLCSSSRRRSGKVADSRLRSEKPWMKGAGALKHFHKETVRIQKLIDDEFEQIEPELWV